MALEQRGVEDAIADPDGGRLVRDDQGRITGYCLDAAQALVVPIAVDIGHHGPGFHDDEPLDEIVGDIDRASRLLAAGILDRRRPGHQQRLDGYRAARDRGSWAFG